ncbi:hypothetical protein HOP50_06g42990 [Chloropicon primus]|uniref:Uncharacterized protein n=1 Tax=Chloropicon primus TaxID=1764295 RepID=A0A5B8MMI4_9CHLO|nr:hypothetical protein A3770_06p42740 [Chloropicon primus]UPR00978.1 hypothetical protein HOP50_06g42990 [Chloropicon primus]|eukprot:QDZ21756.1 hypothetical protein A3770_06p42740 [Chloropicon primus]
MGCAQSSPSPPAEAAARKGAGGEPAAKGSDQTRDTAVRTVTETAGKETEVEALKFEPAVVEASDGLDDQLESEMHRLVHAKEEGPPAKPQRHGESSAREQERQAGPKGSSTQLRERTNIIQNDEMNGEGGRQPKYATFSDDKENISQGREPSAVARRSSILQLIEDTRFEDDSDFDEDNSDAEFDDEGNRGRSNFGNGDVVPVVSNYNGRNGNFGMNKLNALDQDYQTPAMDSLYKMKDSQDSLAQGSMEDPGQLEEEEEFDLTGDHLELTDADDPFLRDSGNGISIPEPPDDTTGRVSNLNITMDTVESQNETNEGVYALETGSSMMMEGAYTSSGEQEGHTIGTMEMGDTLGGGYGSSFQDRHNLNDDSMVSHQDEDDEDDENDVEVQMDGTFDTMGTRRTEDEDEGDDDDEEGEDDDEDDEDAFDQFDVHNNNLRRGGPGESQGPVPIDTYDLTEEDKVWRSLTNQYASINSDVTVSTNDISDSHHTLISQDATTLETHHTLSQDSGPQTLDSFHDQSNLSRKVGGWEGDFAMTGTLMMGNENLDTLPETAEYKEASLDPSLGMEAAVNAGDLVLEDEFDI